MSRRIMHQIRFFYGFGRHWLAGLPDHQPNLDDPVIAEAVRVGQASVEAHLSARAAEEAEKVAVTARHRRG